MGTTASNADGGRYSVTITGHRTRNTAERVLGLHKPFFSLASPAHDDSDDQQPQLPALADKNEDAKLQDERRSSASASTLSIIVFLTNLYLRFRRLFDLKLPSSNPASPARRNSHDTLMNINSAMAHYGTHVNVNADVNADAFYMCAGEFEGANLSVSNGFAAQADTACETCQMQFEILLSDDAPFHSNCSYYNPSTLKHSHSHKAFDRTRTEPCSHYLYSSTAPTLAYLHQAHRRFVNSETEPLESLSALQRVRLTTRYRSALSDCDHALQSHLLTYNDVCNTALLSTASSSLQATTTTASESSSKGRFNGIRPGPLGPVTSCPPPPVKSKSIDRVPKSAQYLRCHSWPPLQRKNIANLEEDLDDDFGFLEGLNKQSTQMEFEFNIPYRDIKFVERLSQGVREAIYRGQWHGEVWVHMYWNLTHAETKRFWEEVTRLSMIRHENVALFMGACMDPPRFAIVSTLRKYPSLYEKLHLMRDTLSQRNKVSIAKQIAQAVSYLHARSICVKRLASSMVYLDPKVKLYLVKLCLDDPDGHAIIRRRDLPYIAPEILRAVQIEPPIPYLRVPDRLFRPESDAYAFGTLLYELFAGGYPFEKLEMDAFVWCVCTGRREDTERLSGSDSIRSLIQDCWAHDPLSRPELFDINAQLSQPGVLKKRCSSDPERLNQLGLRNPY